MTIFNYTVNYFDVGIVVLIILTAIAGWKRGLAISIVNFIRYSFGMFLCFYSSSNFSQPIYESYVKPKLITMINEKIVVSSNIDETINNLNEYVKSLPPAVAGTIDIKSIDISSADITESILTNIFEPIALVLVKIAIFFSVLVVFFGITGIILLIVKRHMKKKDGSKDGPSTLRKTDKVFGMLFGVIKAFIVVLAISSIIMFFVDMDEEVINESGFFKEASQSGILMFIQEINPFNAITEGLI